MLCVLHLWDADTFRLGDLLKLMLRKLRVAKWLR